MVKKTKILAVTTLYALSAGLSSCVQADGAKILTFANGETVTADELLDTYKSSSAGIEAYYNAIYEVVARHIMTNDSEIKDNGRYATLVDQAEVRVNDTKTEAQENADANGSSYSDELESLLDDAGVEDLEELQYKYENELFVDYLEDKFYDDQMDNLLTGGTIQVGGESINVTSYLDDTLPYHVKHLLVNVDASNSDYSRGAISEAQAKKIYSVIEDLVYLGTNTFGTLAREYSDDTGSATSYGDLGIMSKNTSYVSEFKLGIYTYDALFNETDDIDQSRRAKLEIADNEEYEDFKNFLVTEGQGISFVPYGAATILNEQAEYTRDDYGESVNGGNSAYYPRNIIFNEYFNKHNISFITPETVTVNEETGDVTTTTVGEFNAEGVYTIGETATAFRSVTFGQGIGEKVVLCDEQGNPIIMVRAGTGSDSTADGEESSGYEGIHFIVVQRSALVEIENGISLEDYYSMEMPDNDGYITINGQKVTVYVNAYRDVRSVYQERIEALKEEIRSADSSLDKKIFQYWFTRSGATITDSTVEAKLAQYIDADEINNTKTDEESYYSTWEDYYDLLNRQINEEDRKVPMVCYVNFKTASTQDDDGDLFGKGGECYYVQA